jgi:hypothetical protein
VTDNKLPFGGYARDVSAIVAKNSLTTSAGAQSYAFPTVAVEKGFDRNEVELSFPTATKGKVSVTVQCDS